MERNVLDNQHIDVSTNSEKGRNSGKNGAKVQISSEVL